MAAAILSAGPGAPVCQARRRFELAHAGSTPARRLRPARMPSVADVAGWNGDPSRCDDALRRLADEEFDVLVVGGGVTGAGVALDAGQPGPAYGAGRAG